MAILWGVYWYWYHQQIQRGMRTAQEAMDSPLYSTCHALAVLGMCTWVVRGDTPCPGLGRPSQADEFCSQCGHLAGSRCAAWHGLSSNNCCVWPGTAWLYVRIWSVQPGCPCPRGDLSRQPDPPRGALRGVFDGARMGQKPSRSTQGRVSNLNRTLW